MHDQGIPERYPRETVELDGCYHIVSVESDNAPTSEQLNLTLGKVRIDTELSSDSGEVFLHHLEGNHQQAAPLIIRNQSNGARLFLWRRFVIGVDQDIRIE